MWAPAPMIVTIARCSAAWPLAVAMAPTPPSSAATRSSSTAHVGFEIREYTCPARSMLKSAAAWSASGNTNEAVWWMGVARAPVAGSGFAPAWSESVSKRWVLGRVIAGGPDAADGSAASPASRGPTTTSAAALPASNAHWYDASNDRSARHRATAPGASMPSSADLPDRSGERGRGATHNPANRFRRDLRERVDDVAPDGDEPPPSRDDGDDPARTNDHRAQRLARHSVRPLDQSLPGLRARLRVLLRAALARVPRSVARPRLRVATLREARRPGAPPRGARAPRIRVPPDGARHQHRPLSADRAHLADYPRRARGARRVRAPVHHRHQGRTRRARPRHHRPDGGEGHGARVPFGDDARPRNSRAASSRGRRRPDAACKRYGRSLPPACRSA